MRDDESLASHAEQIRDAMQVLAPQVRGLSQHDAEKHLLDEFRRRGILVTPNEVRMLAHAARGPWKTLLHPLKARSLFRQWSQQTAAAEAALEHENAALTARIEDVLESKPGTEWSLHARRDYDRMIYRLVMRPYSDELAQRIREAAAPVPIDIVDD